MRGHPSGACAGGSGGSPVLWCGLGQREKPTYPPWEAGRQTSPAGYSAKTKQRPWKTKRTPTKHFLIPADQTGAGAGGRASVQARGVFSPQQRGD